MRIIGGTLSKRKIDAPIGDTTRPMMDRVREALFNILAHRDWGAQLGEIFDSEPRVLDAFCGTGALAIESLSWGATHATLSEKDTQALKITRQNIAALGIAEKCAVLSVDALHPPQAPAPCTLIFLDPPYRKNMIPPAYAALNAAGWIAPHALIVAATARDEKLETLPDCELIVARGYGETMLHFMTRHAT